MNQPNLYDLKNYRAHARGAANLPAYFIAAALLVGLLSWLDYQDRTHQKAMINQQCTNQRG